MVLLGITLGIIALVASSYLWFKPLFQPKALNSEAIHDVFVRKNPDLDTDRYRPVFFFVGLFFTLLVTFFFFDIKLDELIKIINKVDIEKIEEEIEEIDIQIEEKVIEQKAKPAPIVVSPKIAVVPDNEKVSNVNVKDNDTLNVNNFVEGKVPPGNLNIDIDSSDIVNANLEEEDNNVYDEDEIYEDVSRSYNLNNYLLTKMQANKKINHGIWKPRGIVVINFIVEKDGSISNVKISRKISSVNDQEFYDLIVEIFEKMPNWTPATRKNPKGEIVKARRRCVQPWNF